MITVRDLRLKLNHFSAADLVSAVEDDESNLLAVYAQVLMPPGYLEVVGEPLGAISTISGRVIVFDEGTGEAVEVD